MFSLLYFFSVTTSSIVSYASCHLFPTLVVATVGCERMGDFVEYGSLHDYRVVALDKMWLQTDGLCFPITLSCATELLTVLHPQELVISDTVVSHEGESHLLCSFYIHFSMYTLAGTDRATSIIANRLFINRYFEPFLVFLGLS